MKHVSEVVHELGREQVNSYGGCADERDGDGEHGFECHRGASLPAGG